MRRLQPRSGGVAAQPVGATEHHAMPCDVPSRRGQVRQHEEAVHRRRRLPAEAVGSNRGRQALLSIVTPKGLFERRQLGLDLDHQQRPAGSMPGEDVDRSSLPAHRKCHLRRRFPTEVGQQARHPTDDRGVALVHQSIDLAAAPSNHDNDLGVERPAVPPELLDVAHAPALGARDVVLRQAGRQCYVDLPPAEAMSQCAQNSTDPLVIHARMVTSAAYRTLMESKRTGEFDAALLNGRNYPPLRTQGD